MIETNKGIFYMDFFFFYCSRRMCVFMAVSVVFHLLVCDFVFLCLFYLCHHVRLMIIAWPIIKDYDIQYIILPLSTHYLPKLDIIT